MSDPTSDVTSEGIREGTVTQTSAAVRMAQIGLPSQLGEYTLIELIAQGGMARVYRAFRTDDPELCPVAIKCIHKTDALFMRRLADEARLGQRIKDSHVVKVLEAHLDGLRPYLVLEYVDGLDLRRLLHRVQQRNQILPTEVCLGLLLGITQALRAAHEYCDPVSGEVAPILHCDLKPSNVLLRRDGRIKLADFDSAHQGSWLPDHASPALGTFGYMAPERVALDREVRLAPPSDLFSLGAIAFELLTLRPLYVGSTTEIVQALISGSPYIRQAMSWMPPHVHPRLLALTRHLLAIRIEERPLDAASVERTLNEIARQLQLSVDLPHFLAPYLEHEFFEPTELRLTDTLTVNARQPVAEVRIEKIPVTALTREQLSGICQPRPKKILGPAAVSQQEDATFLRQLTWALGILGTLVLLVVLAWISLPVKIDVVSTPADALVSVQPGCEGASRAVAFTPTAVYSSGPWPVCLTIALPGHIPATTQQVRPPLLRHSTRANESLLKESCVNVRSQPVGLPVFIQNTRRGTTSPEGLKVCGLEPYVPYVIQLESNGLRWDVPEISAEPGQIVDVYQTFGAGLALRPSFFQRCTRFLNAREYLRAIEMCRIAVAQAEAFEHKIEAYELQAEAWFGLKDRLRGCLMLYQGLNLAVFHRDLTLEREIQDLRFAYDCDDVELLPSEDLENAPTAWLDDDMGLPETPTAANSKSTNFLPFDSKSTGSLPTDSKSTDSIPSEAIPGTSESAKSNFSEGDERAALEVGEPPLDSKAPATVPGEEKSVSAGGGNGS